MDNMLRLTLREAPHADPSTLVAWIPGEGLKNRPLLKGYEDNTREAPRLSAELGGLGAYYIFVRM